MKFQHDYEKYLKLFIIFDKIERGDDRGNGTRMLLYPAYKNKPDDWQIQVRKDKVTGIAKILYQPMQYVPVRLRGIYALGVPCQHAAERFCHVYIEQGMYQFRKELKQ